MANTANKLRIIFGETVLGVKGDGFHYMFNYARGGFESLNRNGKEWIYRVPKPAFWRATTCNDRANNFSIKSNMWMGADLFSKAYKAEIIRDGVNLGMPTHPEINDLSNQEFCQELSIKMSYRINTVPATDVDVTYTIYPCGGIKVTCKYFGQKGLPQLPMFGLRFIMPTKAVSFTYDGLSGETYPDRMAGGEAGVYTVEGLPVTPYIVPQECGMHMDTNWVEITRNTTRRNTDTVSENFSLRFEKADETFAFSCLPYTPFELENATHHEELPPARFTVLTIAGKVRGVGGIQTWGADVEEAYHISGEEDHAFSFMIK